MSDPLIEEYVQRATSQLAAENERLREALRRIFAEAHLHDGDDGAWAIDLAAAALNAASGKRTSGHEG